MLISHSRKILFVHIPKTGGSSIIKAIRRKTLDFGKYKDSHDAINYCDFLKYQGYFKFAFIRNPYSLWASAFRFRYPEEKNKININNFRQFIINYSQVKFYSKQHLMFMRSNMIYIDYIGRFEKIQRDFDILCPKIGIEQIKLTIEHDGGDYDYKEYHNNETKELIKNVSRIDLRLFNYDFNGVCSE